MAKLTTHVLDILHGKPGEGVPIELYAIDAGSRTLLKTATTDANGRCATPLLDGEEMQAGMYELVFAAGDYFAAKGVPLPTPRFIDRVAIAFGIAEPQQNYHVPLVISPWAYSTYRGS